MGDGQELVFCRSVFSRVAFDLQSHRHLVLSFSSADSHIISPFTRFSVLINRFGVAFISCAHQIWYRESASAMGVTVVWSEMRLAL
jgi:hypothetical protein